MRPKSHEKFWSTEGGLEGLSGQAGRINRQRNKYSELPRRVTKAAEVRQRSGCQGTGELISVVLGQIFGEQSSSCGWREERSLDVWILSHSS